MTPSLGTSASAGEPLDQSLVTVVIPARDEQAHIERCLTSVLAQDWQRLQVLVVDGASTDGTRELVSAVCARDNRVELLTNPVKTTPAALNLALLRAAGAWFVRVDAHSAVSPTYVSRAVHRLREGRCEGVGGWLHSVGRTAVGRAVAFAMGSRFGVGGSGLRRRSTPQEVEHVVFGCYATELVRRLGGWDERLPSNQDVEFNHRLRAAGGRLLYDPDMIVTYECRQTLRELFVQYQRYGRGKTRLLALHPKGASPRHLVPASLVVALVVAGATSARQRRLAPLTVVAAPYSAVLLAASVSGRAFLEDRAAQACLPAVLVTMHMGYGVGFLRGLRHLVRGPGPATDERR